MYDALTTGQAARACGLSISTIRRAIDDRRLKGYKIPGSKTRRVLVSDLLEMAQRVGISVTEADVKKAQGKPK